MDILVSSNLERLVFHLVGDNAEKTKCLMDTLTRNGSYELQDSDEAIFSQFVAGFATEAETAAEIKRVFELDDYVMDPHTAVASAVYQNYRHETGDDTPTLIASTASPYKFPSVVVEAITGEPVADDFEAVSQLKQLSHVVQPKAVIGLQNARVRHRLLVKTADMQTAVENYLGL